MKCDCGHSFEPVIQYQHRLICADCREPETWQRLLNSIKVNGVFTSPPYAEQRKAQYGGVPTAEYVDWWEAVQANVKANLADDGSFFVNIKPHCEDGQRVLYVMDLVLAMVRRWEWRHIDELSWQRTAIPGNMGPRFKNEFEPIYHFALSENVRFRPKNVIDTDADLSRAKTYDQTDGSVTLGSNYNGHGGGNVRSKNFDGALPGNVLKINKGFGENPGHGAVFPPALPDFFIRAYSDPGDVWLDPFVGSGTTMLAAHNNGRIGLGIERLPAYCAVILERFAAIGVTAELITDAVLEAV